jgi:hypothetical protein
MMELDLQCMSAIQMYVTVADKKPIPTTPEPRASLYPLESTF